MESVLDNITVLYDQLFDAEKKIAKYIFLSLTVVHIKTLQKY